MRAKLDLGNTRGFMKSRPPPPVVGWGVVGCGGCDGVGGREAGWGEGGSWLNLPANQPPPPGFAVGFNDRARPTPPFP